MGERDEMEGDGMNESAERAARLLRADVPVRAEWRSALLTRIEADSPLDRRPKGWTFRPAMAIAASVLLVVIGAAGALLMSRSLNSPDVAAVPQSAKPVVRFVYVAPGAAHVSVVGDFNQWNPTAVPLRRLSDGTWIADVPLVPGRYAYAFVVDGKLEADPTAPRATDSDFGVANSIVMVRGS
jgi:hypothetical protein